MNANRVTGCGTELTCDPLFPVFGFTKNAGGNEFKNNIFYKLGNPSLTGAGSIDYNYTDTIGLTGSNWQRITSSPFFDTANYDFRPTTQMGGVVLDDEYKIDAYGNDRTAGGEWTVGAYAFVMFPPIITSITPNKGKQNSSFMIKGINLLNKIVKFDTIEVTDTSTTDTIITGTIPSTLNYKNYNVIVGDSINGWDTLINGFRVIKHKSNNFMIYDTLRTSIFELTRKSKCWLDTSSTINGTYNPVDSTQGEAGTIDTLQGVSGKYHRGRCVTLP